MSWKENVILFLPSEDKFILKTMTEKEIIEDGNVMDFSNEEIYEKIIENPQRVTEALNQMQNELKICGSLIGGHLSIGGSCFFLGEDSHEEELLKRLKR